MPACLCVFLCKMAFYIFFFRSCVRACGLPFGFLWGCGWRVFFNRKGGFMCEGVNCSEYEYIPPAAST